MSDEGSAGRWLFGEEGDEWKPSSGICQNTDSTLEAAPCSNALSHPDGVEEEHPRSKAGREKDHFKGYRSPKREQTVFTDPTKRDGPTTYSTIKIGTVGDLDGISKFEKLHAGSGTIKEPSATLTKDSRRGGASGQKFNSSIHADSAKTPAHTENLGGDPLKTQREVARPNEHVNIPECTASTREKKRRRSETEEHNETDPFNEACIRNISFLEQQLQSYRAQLEGSYARTGTADELNARLRVSKEVSNMSETKLRLAEKIAFTSKEDDEMYLRLVEGYDRHRERAEAGKSSLIRGPLKRYNHFKRGAVLWLPICQRACNPLAEPDIRRIPSHNGLIDDTVRLVVTIAVDRYNLWVCPVTTRSGRGATGLHNKATWGWLQGHHVEDDLNPGLSAFKVSSEEGSILARSQISSSSIFRPEFPIEIRPRKDYRYVGRLDTESIKKLWLPSGYDENGNILETEEIPVDNCAESISHVSNAREQWYRPQAFEQEDTRPRKKQKTGYERGSGAMSHTTGPYTGRPAASTIDGTPLNTLPPRAVPQPHSPQAYDRLEPRDDDEPQARTRVQDSPRATSEGERSTFLMPDPKLDQSTRLGIVQSDAPRETPRRRDSVRDGDRRPDWDDPNYDGGSRGGLDYGD
ncbi:hypothetical protein SLS60_002350 [Paraconiothyrium brasiliense]|uniref:Uncharacterized protein n=1 Tax=Paraconiothyrium brasiliense TaxID=300254 RepID=A0ABR3S1Y4_9PLEO